MSSEKKRRKRRETAWAVLHGDAYDGESNDAAIAYVSGLEREVEALRVAVTARDVALRECADHAEQLRATIQRVRAVIAPHASTPPGMWHCPCCRTVMNALDGGDALTADETREGTE